MSEIYFSYTTYSPPHPPFMMNSRKQHYPFFYKFYMHFLFFWIILNNKKDRFFFLHCFFFSVCLPFDRFQSNALIPQDKSDAITRQDGRGFSILWLVIIDGCLMHTCSFTAADDWHDLSPLRWGCLFENRALTCEPTEKIQSMYHPVRIQQDPERFLFDIDGCKWCDGRHKWGCVQWSWSPIPLCSSFLKLILSRNKKWGSTGMFFFIVKWVC